MLIYKCNIQIFFSEDIMKNFERLKTNLFLAVFFVSALLFSTGSNAEEIIAKVSPNNSLFMTVYNDKVLVKDTRNVKLNKGRNTVIVTGIPYQIKADTLSIAGKDIDVVEQSLQAGVYGDGQIRNNIVGKKVKITFINPVTGKEKVENLEVVSAYGGFLVKRDGMIEKIDEKSDYISIAYPASLAKEFIDDSLGRNYLEVVIDTDYSGERALEFTYLTDGVSWQNSYAVNLSEDGNSADLSGWVVLKNISGADFNNADVALSSDSISTAIKAPASSGGCSKCKKCSQKRKKSKENKVEVQGASSSSCGLVLRHPVTLKSGETKNVALIAKENIPVVKEFRIQNPVVVHDNGANGIAKQYAKVWVNFENTKSNALGGEIYPAGKINIYQNKGNGVEYVDEKVMPVVTEGAKINLLYSDSDEISYSGKRTEHKVSEDKKSYTNSFEITFANDGAKNAKVNVNQHFPGRWKINSESIKHERKNSSIAMWDIEIPAKSSKTLKFTVEVKK
jgi:hypothetical protein